ncbi:MAG: DUF4286 family protein [Bradymonadaceae bacterium]|nr:DUF4286 family protein [Lujinxingiaceae bacterium]
MLYIVYIAIDQDIAPEWEAWMTQTHIPDVLHTQAFESAVLARDPNADQATRRAYRAIYLAKDEQALTHYQHHHAPALQAEHTERYAGRFEAHREILGRVP